MKRVLCTAGVGFYLVFLFASCQQPTSTSSPKDKASSISRFDGLATLPFQENRPTQETAKTLSDELLFQRATQTYLWALPLINTLGMKNGSEKIFGAGYIGFRNSGKGFWNVRVGDRTNLRRKQSLNTFAAEEYGCSIIGTWRNVWPTA